jgi:hypothetical protein
MRRHVMVDKQSIGFSVEALGTQLAIVERATGQVTLRLY